MRRVLPAVLLMLVAAACGGNGGESIFGTTSTLDGATTTTRSGSGDTTGTTAADTTTTAPTTTTTTTTTTIPPTVVALEAMTTAASEPADPPESGVGTPDTATATAIADELVAAGVGLTGVDVWVLPMVGTGEKMLVFAVDASAEQLASEDSDVDLFEVLPTLPSLAEADDITRFTLHYYDSDEEGDYVLTTTVLLDLLFGSDIGDIPEDQVGVQLVRLP